MRALGLELLSGAGRDAVGSIGSVSVLGVPPLPGRLASRARVLAPAAHGTNGHHHPHGKPRATRSGGHLPLVSRVLQSPTIPCAQPWRRHEYQCALQWRQAA